jgi:hypothetical protein
MLGSKRAVFARTLRRGHSGEDVRQLQELLQSAGHSPGSIDGNFGTRTHSAVVAFQREQGLVADGLAGPKTTAALTAAVCTGGSSDGRAPVGLSLHIGLNNVNDAAYGFHVPPLSGCVNDANDMQDIARSKGFRNRQLLNEAATSTAVIDAIQTAAAQLAAGDILWISYSGHGSQVPDPLEDDRLSETWVLWDRQLIDNELYALWGRFQPGVRVMVISDSCHSGTVTRELLVLNSEITQAVEQAVTRGIDAPAADKRTVLSTDSAVALALTLSETVPTLLQTHGITRPAAARAVISEVMSRVVPPTTRAVTVADVPRLLQPYLAADDASRRASLYRDVASASAGSPAPQCWVLLISGCQDNQTSSDGRPDPSGHQNGAFTKLLRQEWMSATDYADLHAAILRQMPPTQSPNIFWATTRDTAFEAQSPFTI